MTAVVIGLAIVLVGFYLVTAAMLQARQQRARLEVAQRIPTLVVDDFMVRRATPSDVDTILETADRAFMDANGWNRKVVEATEAQLHRIGPEHLGYVPVCDAADGSMVGYGVLSGVDPSRSRCSLGFSLHPSRRSQGLGPGALAAVIEAVHRAGVRTIALGTRPTNGAMISCISRAGGTEVRRGRTRLPDGSRADSVWFEHRQPQPQRPA